MFAKNKPVDLILGFAAGEMAQLLREHTVFFAGNLSWIPSHKSRRETLTQKKEHAIDTPFFKVFWDRLSLGSTCRPGTHYVDDAVKFTDAGLPKSVDKEIIIKSTVDHVELEMEVLFLSLTISQHPWFPSFWAWKQNKYNEDTRARNTAYLQRMRRARDSLLKLCFSLAKEAWGFHWGDTFT